MNDLKHLSLLALFAVTACAVGPDYERPQVELPTAYKETGEWTPARPRDEADRGAWWAIYKDPVLNGLMEQIDISNQNLKAAEAAWRAARAASDEANASLFPSLAVNGSGTRKGIGTASPQNTYAADVSGSWDIDLWGGIRRSVESGDASAEASAADLASARLSAQADLAANY